MDVTIKRHISLEGSYNFRDIGGYETADNRTVRWRRLFRSDALARLTDNDLVQLQPLGVVTLIDLRTALEIETSGPSQLIAAQGVAHRHHPFAQDPVDPNNINDLPDMPTLYAQLIETGHETISKIFTTLADNTTYPAVVHCAAGKDRTGIVTALLMRTLGVPDETIIADYALTELYMAELKVRLQAQGMGHYFDNIRPEILESKTQTMQGFLDLVDTRFGGTLSLLEQCGLPADIRGELQQQLLEG